MTMGRLSTQRKVARPGSQLAVALAPRHAFYDRCNDLLAAAEFDARGCVSPTTRKRSAGLPFPPAGISACCSSVSSRAWTPSVRSPGAARIPCHYTGFCAWATRRNNRL